MHFGILDSSRAAAQYALLLAFVAKFLCKLAEGDFLTVAEVLEPPTAGAPALSTKILSHTLGAFRVCLGSVARLVRKPS